MTARHLADGREEGMMVGIVEGTAER